MFGLYQTALAAKEMTREETVAHLRDRGVKPADLSVDDWALVMAAGPDNEDPDYVSDTLCDLMMNEGDGVLSLGWDGDGPGHSGIKSVATWEGLYFFTSSDHDDHGPYKDIDDVLELEYFDQDGVPNGSLYFTSPPVPKDRGEMIAYAMCGEDGGQVDLNGVMHERRDGELCPVDELDMD